MCRSCRLGKFDKVYTLASTFSTLPCFFGIRLNYKTKSFINEKGVFEMYTFQSFLAFLEILRKMATYLCTLFCFLRRILLETLNDYYMLLHSVRSLHSFKGCWRRKTQLSHLLSNTSSVISGLCKGPFINEKPSWMIDGLKCRKG